MVWTRKQNNGFVSYLLLLYLIHKTQVTTAFVVPSQLPGVITLLEHPAKAGIDSRLGFGFRLGNNADFQLVLELGPQAETRFIGERSKDNKPSNKRQKFLLSQPLRQRVQETEMLKTSNEQNTASWLTSWSKDMKLQKNKSKFVKESPQRHLEGQLISIQQLQSLYKLATTFNSSSTRSPTISAPNPEQAMNPDPPANPDPATNPDPPANPQLI